VISRRALLASSLSATAAMAANPTNVGPPKARAVRGVTVSCPTWGWEWGTDAMVQTMEELAGLGANWIAIHPYARIRKTGDVGWRRMDPSSPPDWLQRPIKTGQRLGMQVLIKPHLAYWGSGFSWRGEIEFRDDAVRARFFEQYARWVTELARCAAGAGAFSVATELGGVRDEGAWRGVIDRVRQVFDGPLTAAVNWDRYQQIPWWDAVDAVGVQAYFPLLKQMPATGVPSDDALRDGWRSIHAELRGVHERTGKPIVFTELGYNRSRQAPVQPWDYQQGGEDAEQVQAACLRVALREAEREPWMAGSFLWKWFPGDARRENFLMSTEAMRAVIRQAWT
jgi:hypothetical protein